jgi:spermidine/putrescine transport system permease protein
MRAWIANPWGKPRFLALFTWLYVVWSIVPVIIAVAFSFNDGRSRTAWQGFSLRWYYHDPLGSVWQDETLRQAMYHSLELAFFAMLIATPLGVALALGLQRWQTRSGTAANALMLIPLITPELVMGASMFILFTQVFGFIGLGTPAQVIGQVTFAISYVVVIVRGRLASIGPEYEEAAADLGAPARDVLRRVLLPLLSPAIVSSLLIVFALSIDDFVVTSYLAKGSDTETVPIKLYSAARGAPTPALNALASIMVVVTLVSLALAYFVYKRFARGTGGSALESVGGGI